MNAAARAVLRLALLASTLASAGAAAAQTPPPSELPVASCLLEATLRLEPTSRPIILANDDELEIEVGGVYCGGQGPQLEAVEVADGTVRIETVAAGDLLSFATSPFSLTVPVGRLEAGAWIAELWIDDPGLAPPPGPAATLSFGVGFACFGLQELTVIPSPALPFDPITISASGGWCQGSPPVLQSVEVVGQEVRLHAVADSSGPAVVSEWEIDATVDPLPPGEYVVSLLLADLSLPGPPQVAARTSLTVGELCGPSETALCLNRGRFEVETTWRAPDGRSGPGMPVASTADSGQFWFFDPDNVELDVKVLDGCDLPGFGTYWVFVAGLTDVGVDLTVIDRATGEQWTRSTPVGQSFQPILDTGAFDTCP